MTPKISLTQFFYISKFLLTQIFALIWNISLTPFFWPSFFADTNFCFDRKILTQNISLIPIFWPKITCNPRFYHYPKNSTQNFWINGLWPVFFGSASTKKFRSIAHGLKFLVSNWKQYRHFGYWPKNIEKFCIQDRKLQLQKWPEVFWNDCKNKLSHV